MVEIRRCVVCGKEFTTGPLLNKDTCSPVCSEIKMLAWLFFVKNNKKKLMEMALKYYAKHGKYLPEWFIERWK